MLGRGINSSLFIDYENFSQRLFAERIPSWLAWLEDGGFDPERRRRHFVEKRIYWNSTAERHREKFLQFGFEAILCEKFSNLKNGADIRMTLDILESTFEKPKIQEYVLITNDSDFVPVLQKLREKAKRTAILVNEQAIQVHTTYWQRADAIIEVRKLMEATTYKRPPKGFLPWLRALSEKSKAPGEPAPGETVAPAPRPEHDLLEEAVKCVIRATSGKPRQYTAQKDIEGELRNIKEFSTTGKRKYLGFNTYRALMQEVAKRSDRIKVFLQKGGGTGVQYFPKDEE